MRRRAFTIIELLVVIAVIGILSGLLLSSISWIMRRSRLMVTEGRLQNALTSVQTAEASGNRVHAVMAGGLGDPLDFATLRNVAAVLVPPDNWPNDPDKEYKTTDDGGGTVAKRIPPMLAYRYGNNGLIGYEYADKFHLAEQYAAWMKPDDFEVLPSPALRKGERPLRMWYRNRWPMSWPQTNWRVWEPAPSWDPLLSPLYDPVQDAFADAKANSGSAPYTSYLPANDDGQDKAYYHPPRWMHPWGKEPLHLILGDWAVSGGMTSKLQAALKADQAPSCQRWPHPLGPPGTAMSHGGYLAADLLPVPETGRSLADLGPLETVGLLQYGGILPAGAEGIKTYCDSRQASQPWNDRWGNPLILAHAAWIAPRWDPVMDGKAMPTANGNGFRIDQVRLIDFWGDGALDESSFLVGPRDRLMRKAQAKYGCSSALYLTAGAAGETLHAEVYSAAACDGASLVFDPKRLPQTVRALWLQITEATGAAAWDDAAMAKPPWKGMHRGSLAGRPDIESYILPPVEIR